MVRPLDAIQSTKEVKELAVVLAEVMVTHYPTYTWKDWAVWAAKYKSLPTAKRCAVRMYFRVNGL